MSQCVQCCSVSTEKIEKELIKVNFPQSKGTLYTSNTNDIALFT